MLIPARFEALTPALSREGAGEGAARSPEDGGGKRIAETSVKTHKLTLAASFLALGVLFPVVFHAIGLGGVFLPMFWPVAASGFFLPLSLAVLVGVLTPVLSLLLTGMPPPPILPVMMPELAVLAATVHMMRRKAGMAVWPSLFLGLLVSRAVLFFSARLLGRTLGLPPHWASAAELARSLPGLAAILLFVPAVVGRLLHESVFLRRRPHG